MHKTEGIDIANSLNTQSKDNHCIIQKQTLICWASSQVMPSSIRDCGPAFMFSS